MVLISFYYNDTRFDLSIAMIHRFDPFKNPRAIRDCKPTKSLRTTAGQRGAALRAAGGGNMDFFDSTIQQYWAYGLEKFHGPLSSPAFPTLLAFATYFFANIPLMAIDLAALDWSQVRETRGCWWGGGERQIYSA
jgi:hypothetical protein